MSQPRSSMLLSLILAILAIASIGFTQPITTRTSISRSQLHARTPSPRVIPQSAELRNSIMNDIFDSVGLHALSKLNQWKEKIEKSDIIDDSTSLNSTITAQHNAVVSETPKAVNEDHKTGLAHPIEDPLGFVTGVFAAVSSKVSQVFNSQDEITLGV
ncbi:uncharacterized protein ACLA_025280 [Aspergillus clavatus NRRL 1]|uniref:GPI anchored protein n=1 Tax=Aspergillus clavatus (strain ATCC 1007 / CBS 513.65 / DSM 816 / NCTC 3887 / NRRL 1 / QM 1276 / 107) TaxID=344612 RepID=A1CQ90_ASPCL|nr:uncharacterized protein ACLA_025280 [Aspergillus clavatus NRRL 1]EAW07811.1 conserved hypothetical protein [Aspergillus clavatus NRRL 1]